MLNDGLRDILAKQPVVNTKLAEQLLTEPQEVEHAYLEHYHTHVSLGDTDDFIKRLSGRIRQGKTSKGAVVAPWGYGKTSTLIFTWKACEDQNLVAVPPFICSSWQDILTATYGWLRFRLGRELASELESVYYQYSRAAFEDHVKSVAREAGVNEVDARAILEREKRLGMPIGELTPANLLHFLEYAARLVTQRGGFDGLVILSDELQQMIDPTPNLRATIQQIREIVLWLGTNNDLPLALIFCMPDTIEGKIQEDGNDILDRLRTDRLYINLRDVYNVGFPAELWQRYGERFELGEVAERVIHRYTLQSIGQIATREDLGRGPRTVVDALQCAIRHYDKTGEIYTPIDLIDDFMNGQMSFDTGQITNAGQVHTIRSAVEDVLALGNIIKTPEHRKAVKLWAAFPEHGCPDEVLKEFEVPQQVADEISHHGHGELLTYQTSGYTLRKLASFTPGGEIVERIARDFWRAYRDEDPQWAEAAQRGFINAVLPEIFDPKKWRRLDNGTMHPTPLRGYAARLEGTFTDAFPKRLIDVQVGTSSERIEPRKPNAITDLQFDFVVARQFETATGRVELVGDDPHWLRFVLNFNSHALASDQLPRDLLNLKASIHPRRLTPQLMLAFVDYCDHWEQQQEGNRISPGERGKVNAIRVSMINYAIRVLFNDDLCATAPIRLQMNGVAIVRELFTTTLKTLYPRYSSLWAAGEQSLKDYIGALERLTLKEKRGQRPLAEQRKSQIASLFGTSWATLNNRAKSGYASLLKMEETRGDEAQVTLLLHPMELLILKALEQSVQHINIDGRELPVLSLQYFLTAANKEGCRDDEASWVLKLLAARELVQADKSTASIYRLPAGPPAAQVKQQMDTLLTALQSLPATLVTEREKTGLLTRLGEIQTRFTPDLEEEILEEMALDIGRVETQYKDLLEQKQHTLYSDLDTLVRQLEQCRIELDHTPELEGEIGPGLDFRRTLIDMQRELRIERDRLRKEINLLKQAVIETQKRLEVGDHQSIQQGSQYTNAAKKRYQEITERCQTLARARKGFQEWLKLLRETDELYKTLATLPQLRDKLVEDIVRRINQNFARRRLDALAEDAEQFQGECNELIRQRDTWVATQRDEFLKRKESLRAWLKAMGVERPDFSARYDHLEHEKSYEEMYVQVINIAKQHIENLHHQSDEARLDLKRARQIQWAKLESTQREMLKSLEKSQIQLEKRREAILQTVNNLNLVEATEEILTSLAQQVSELLTELCHVKTDLQQFLKPVDPKTDSEKDVLDLLRGQREMDLTDLVLKTDQDLTQIMEGLIGLYQGNHIIIKVTRRE